MEIGEKYLPVGTVCLLQNGTKKVMITGFCVQSPDIQGRVFDYIGCLYPEGVVSSDQNLLFDHSQIAQVFYKGYVCDEETEFKKKLAELINAKINQQPAPVENQNTPNDQTPESI